MHPTKGFRDVDFLLYLLRQIHFCQMAWRFLRSRYFNWTPEAPGCSQVRLCCRVNVHGRSRFNNWIAGAGLVGSFLFSSSFCMKSFYWWFSPDKLHRVAALIYLNLIWQRNKNDPSLKFFTFGKKIRNHGGLENELNKRSILVLSAWSAQRTNISFWNTQSPL